jgi:hypothetical protein
VKIRNTLTKALLASALAISQNLFFVSSSNQVKAQGGIRPYVVFVNGQGNCCTWGTYTDGSPDPFMDIVVGALPSNTDKRYVPYSNFRNGG